MALMGQYEYVRSWFLLENVLMYHVSVSFWSIISDLSLGYILAKGAMMWLARSPRFVARCIRELEQTMYFIDHRRMDADIGRPIRDLNSLII